ncbi:exopolysaccharide biosynthesis protein [Rubrivivax sp. A210]|uniref:exopolysaccharide biosynthesis protein n=1 Tax=Rubrivivax sp. A210 TaxID=2772301 RepID=UPI00191A2CC8|nr:exopolysaccharide biosynthesis protein [Rubrivivax sp. A210]
MTSPLAQRLRDAAAALQGERVSVAALLRAHGPQAHGSLLLLMAVPCLLPIPGTGTVLGLGLLAMALALWRGRPEAALPQRVAELEMSRAWAHRVLTTLATLYALAARVTQARLAWVVAAPAHRWIAATVGAMGAVLVLPIPFGNVLPALALVLIGLGLVFNDGVPVVLGMATALATAALTLALLAVVADWGSGWVGQVLA